MRVFRWRGPTAARRDAGSLSNPSSQTNAADHFVGVQVLRGVAALLVVVFHAGLMLHDRFPAIGDNWLLRFGAAGVDIFFPISGFVMLLSTRALLGRADAWRVFLRRRIIRIVPLYWLATTAKVAALVIAPALALHATLDPWHVAASYLFIFAEDSRGVAQPVVPIGWTLNYEMFFYAVMVLVLFWRRALVPWTVGLILGAAAGSFVVPRGTTPLLVCHPIILEFIAGMGIALLVERDRRLQPAPALGTAAIALGLLVASDAVDSATVERWRLLVWGLPSALLLYAVVSLERHVVGRFWYLPRLLGDASYALYLSHGFVLPILAVIFSRLGLAGPAWGGPLFALAILASIAVGIATHLWVERPVTEWLSHRRRGATPLPEAGALVR